MPICVLAFCGSSDCDRRNETLLKKFVQQHSSICFVYCYVQCTDVVRMASDLCANKSVSMQETQEIMVNLMM